MLRTSLLIAFTACTTALAAVAASPEQRPLRPYPPVAVVLPMGSTDDSFNAFRAELSAAANIRVYSRLARLVRVDDFFWDRDFGRGFDPRKPAVDNLAAALALESDNGSGWALLAELAAEAAVEPLASRPGVVCAPAHPSYDSVAVARLLDTTFTSGSDWAYPRAAETPMRAAPRADATATGSLGPHFVQLLGFEGSDREPSPARTQWARVATPDGQKGFVAPGSLMSLAAAQLCYMKDPIVGWRIAGYIAGGHQHKKSQR
jgi:hypothetical protein